MTNDPHTLMRGVWLKDYASKSLLQYEMTGKEPAGKGPIIEVHDGSGSMAGEKFEWASSVALALLTIAQQEKRDFAGVEFGSAHQLKSWFFPKAQPPDPNEVLDYATHFYSGGTDTETGMREALRIIKEVPEFSTADVVVIADGDDYFEDGDKQVRDELRDMGVRIHGISVLSPGNDYLAMMCEYVVDVIDLAGPNDATDRLAAEIT